MEQKKIETTLYGSARRGDSAEAFFGSLTCTNCGAELTEAARSCNNCGMPVPEEAVPREAPGPQETIVPPDQPPSPPLPSHSPMQRSTFDLRALREKASPQQEEGEAPPALQEVISAQGIGGPSGASLAFSVAQRKRALLLASAVVALLVLASGGAVALAGVGSIGGSLEGSEPPQPVDEAQPSDSQEKDAASGEETGEASYEVFGDVSASSPSPGGPTPSEEVPPSVPSVSGSTLSEEAAPSLHPERGYSKPESSGQETSKDKADVKSSPAPAPEEDETPAGSWAEEAETKNAPPAATKGPYSDGQNS